MVHNSIIIIPQHKFKLNVTGKKNLETLPVGGYMHLLFCHEASF